jgi:predicted AAA+ superfamily ATPase
MEVLPRFLDIPKRSLFLFGPRGTGKSTWLRKSVPSALYVDLLDPGRYRELAAEPERLRQLVEGSPQSETVIVDEIQRLPELLTQIHALIEEAPRRRFVLTGSSARKLRRGGVDLLAGRAVVRTLHPFMGAELPGFSLETALEQGLVPLVVRSSDPADVLRAYVSLYIDEEVRTEGWVRNIGAFARFLEAASFSHAAVLNLANVARECSVEQKTVAAWIEVLEDLLLAFRLPVFSRRARRRTTVHPKLYFFDAGVYRSLRPKGPLDRREEIDGAALEGLVAQHLRAWSAYSDEDFALSFWRTPAGTEVDFVIYGESGFWAVEVKNTRRIRPADLRALKTFKADYPASEPLLLYRGEDRLVIDGIRCLPVGRFLSELHPARGLSDQR